MIDHLIQGDSLHQSHFSNAILYIDIYFYEFCDNVF